MSHGSTTYSESVFNVASLFSIPLLSDVHIANVKSLIIQVNYNLSNWLDKNKDPINETVVDLLSHSKEALVQTLFAHEPGLLIMSLCGLVVHSQDFKHGSVYFNKDTLDIDVYAEHRINTDWGFNTPIPNCPFLD